MTTKQNPKFQELVAKLREIFQIDRPELDFGIYRILNARAGEINDYLQNRLAEKVQQALSSGNEAQREQVARELKEKEAHYIADGINPDNVPKVQELRQKLAQYSAAASEHENAVFSHLLTFFSRYYQDGDFISQRRYKGDTYAIPYAGEEVMLHWANKDQYYTKSGENFSNYSFKLEDGRTVHFRLAAADTAKDNRKDNDKERRFVLVTAKTVTRVDENGDEYEEELVPVEEASGSDGKQELIIRFEYAAQPKGTKQEALVTKAVETVLADAAVKARWLALGNRAPTEKNPQRTLLEKHLSDYTTKNTADYFIHKDLGGFLRRELDFYIKNEVMHLDDVQNAGAFADIEKNLRMIQCLRSIALELITFLAQLEDFQKKLWLKKKFVVSSHYCITLDRVPEALWPEVVANGRQWEQWKQLGVWDGDAPGTLEDLKAAPYRMVDTALFDDDFKRRLLASIENIESSLDGVVINSDNFQALTFIRERFRREVKCVYIDPPYNKGNDFAYKDSYRHSSWISSLHDKTTSARWLLHENAIQWTSLDENEAENYHRLVANLGIFRETKLLTAITNLKGTYDADGFVATHEYVVCGTVSSLKDVGEIPVPEDKVESDWSTDTYGLFKQGDGLRRTGADAPRARRPNGWFPIFVTDEGCIYVTENDVPLTIGDTAVYPIDSNKEELSWSWSKRKIRDEAHNIILKGSKDAGYSFYKKQRPGLGGIPTRKSKSFLYKPEYSSTHGGNTVKDLFGKRLSEFTPKSVALISDLILLGKSENSIVLDYFAGSGTTAHAVISLNRLDSASRKYILVEQGEYFDAVLKLRIQKVIYSAHWKDGKPTAPETGISHCFKVLKLESYEDTLNNLQLRRTSAQGDLLNTLPQQAKDDYLLNYLLDVESRGSLLSVEDFRKPFDYQLNIAVDSAGAYEARKIDLVETFNYLIGLRVKHIDMQPARGFVTVTGTLPSGESCLVLWRDCDVLDYEGVSKLCDKLAINPADNEFDVVYINGDHNIPTVLTQTAEEGGATRVLKLRQIEPEFLDRMFSVEDI